MSADWIFLLVPVVSTVLTFFVLRYENGPPFKNATSYPRIKFWTFVASYDIAPENWRVEDYDVYRKVKNSFVEVLFETRRDYRRFKRWQSKRQKAEKKRKQEEINAKIREEILKDYENFGEPKKPNQEFVPPPTAKKMPAPPTTGTNVINQKKDKYADWAYIWQTAEDGTPFCTIAKSDYLEELHKEEERRQEKMKEAFYSKGVNFD